MRHLKWPDEFSDIEDENTVPVDDAVPVGNMAPQPPEEPLGSASNKFAQGMLLIDMASMCITKGSYRNWH